MIVLNLLLAALWAALGLFDERGMDGDSDSQGEKDDDAQGAKDDDKSQGDDSESQGDGEKDGSDDDTPAGRRLSRDLAKAKERIKQFEADKAERDRAAMSEADKLKAERAEFDKDRAAFKAEQATEKLNRAIEAAAKKAGFNDPADAISLIKPDAVTDSDGALDEKALSTALKTLTDSKPYLVSSGSSSPANGQRSGSSATLTLEDANRLAKENPAEFNKRFDAGDAALMKALSGG